MPPLGFWLEWDEGYLFNQLEIAKALNSADVFDFPYLPQEGDLLQICYRGRTFFFEFVDQRWGEPSESAKMKRVDEGWSFIEKDGGTLTWKDAPLAPEAKPMGVPDRPVAPIRNALGLTLVNVFKSGASHTTTFLWRAFIFLVVTLLIFFVGVASSYWL